MRFRLHKIYLDCVSPAGEIGIAYAADLCLGPLRWAWSGLITAAPGEPTRALGRWRRGLLRREGGTLEWSCAPLAACGKWLAPTPLGERTLFAATAGMIRWNCLQAAGPAQIARKGAPVIVGQGYAEELELDLLPWRLPFAELRWGRFIGESGGHSLVWIDWRDGLERRWCLLDRQEITATLVDDSRVEWAGGGLTLDDRRELHHAPLASTVLGRARLLARLWPGGLGRAVETKWLSRGALHEASATRARGWAVHEVVRWR